MEKLRNALVELGLPSEEVAEIEELVKKKLATQMFARRTHDRDKSSSSDPRKTALIDLVLGEREYQSHLQALIKCYMLPLQSAGPKVIKPEQFADIFCNIDAIDAVQKDLVTKLEKALQEWPTIPVGPIFLEIAPTLKNYAQYVSNFHVAMDTLKQLRKSSKFANFIKTCTQNDQSGLDLEILIASPLNRIGQSLIALENLTSKTSQEHTADHEYLNKACRMMLELQEFITDSLSQGGCMGQLISIKKRLIGYEDKIVTPHRVFLKEGVLMMKEEPRESAANASGSPAQSKSAKEREYHCFLFNDVLLYTTGGTPSSGGHQVKGDIRLGGAVLMVPSVAEQKVAYSFTLQTKTSNFVFNASSAADRQAWLGELEKIYEQLRANRVFGVSLRELMSRPAEKARKYPRFVEKVVKYLEERELTKTEGIFRLSGSALTIAALREAIDRGVEVKFPPDPNVVAGLLKLFVRELPEPLILPDTANELVRVAEYVVSKQRPAHAELHSHLQEMKAILARLPACHFTTLEYLVAFLRRISDLAEHNKMTRSNIAIVFAPNILRIGNVGMFDIRPACNVLEVLMEHYTELFSASASATASPANATNPQTSTGPPATGDVPPPKPTTSLPLKGSQCAVMGAQRPLSGPKLVQSTAGNAHQENGTQPTSSRSDSQSNRTSIGTTKPPVPPRSLSRPAGYPTETSWKAANESVASSSVAQEKEITIAHERQSTNTAANAQGSTPKRERLPTWHNQAKPAN